MCTWVTTNAGHARSGTRSRDCPRRRPRRSSPHPGTGRSRSDRVIVTDTQFMARTGDAADGTVMQDLRVGHLPSVSRDSAGSRGRAQAIFAGPAVAARCRRSPHSFRVGGGAATSSRWCQQRTHFCAYWPRLRSAAPSPRCRLPRRRLRQCGDAGVRRDQRETQLAAEPAQHVSECRVAIQLHLGIERDPITPLAHRLQLSHRFLTPITCAQASASSASCSSANSSPYQVSMNTDSARSPHKAPDLVGGETEHRRHPAHHRLDDVEHRGLDRSGAASCQPAWCIDGP